MQPCRIFIAVWLALRCAGAPIQAQVTPDSWQAEATFYEIFVRSFKDSDGDGIGDFQGILSQLDYLNDGDSTTTDDLGIGGIWLMPINPSPSYHGYDVTDYFGVNPEYGTMADFQELLDACHARGIRVIMDFVGNHSSSAHPHFAASSSGASNAFRDWYVWSDVDPGGDWHDGGSGWYYGLFWSGMPDWNVQHQPVVDHHYAIVDHWLALGIDGFRYDAVKHLVNEGGVYENHPGTFAYLSAFRDHYLSVNPEAICVGEAWTGSDVIAQYGPPHQDMCFEFGLSGGIRAALNAGEGTAFRQALDQVLDVHQTGAYAPFLSNHDQDRIMSVLGGDAEKAQLAAAVLLTLPGTPFVYYGEEIGMTGAGSHPNVRTPMQWAAGAQAGFTSGTPWSAAQPDVDLVNVAAQQGDPEALLATYREFIHLRNATPALQRGSTITWDTDMVEAVALLRTLDGERILVAHNFSQAALSDLSVVPVGLCAGEYGVTDIRTGADLGTAMLTPEQGWSLPLALGPGQTAVLQLTGANEATTCTVPVTLGVDVQPVSSSSIQLPHVRYRIDGGTEFAVQMEMTEVDNWWDVTLALPEGAELTWRFQYGQDPAAAETVPPDCGADFGLGLNERSAQVGNAPMSLDRVCFGACAPCFYPPQQVVLKVDLGDLSPHPDGVHVAGSFQGWNPSATEMATTGDGVYTHTVTAEVGETILYKFINGAAWGGLEEIAIADCGVANGLGGWNRSLTIQPGQWVPVVCFEACTPCVSPPGYILSTYSVDMTFETESWDGLFLEWNHPDSALVPMAYDGNGWWTAVTYPVEGSVVEYRFVNGDNAESLPGGCEGAAEGWRTDLVGAINADFSVPCFGDCAACSFMGGCTYAASPNYDPDAVFDDGSCVITGGCGEGTVLGPFGLCIPDDGCAGDLDGDNLVGVGDILFVLSAFGSGCPP